MTLHEFLSKSNRPTGVTPTISPYQPSASTLVLRPGEAPLYIYRVGPPTVGRFKSTRRLRWTIGRSPASVLGWVVTRKEMLAGPFIAPESPLAWLGETPILRDWVEIEREIDTGHIERCHKHNIWVRRNTRQGWSPSGERIL